MRWASAFDVLDSIRGLCLAELDARERPVIAEGSTWVNVGALTVDDCCGQLTVGLDNITRSTNFPLPALTAENCWGGSIVLAVRVTIVRCVPSVAATGEPPTAAALAAAHQGLYLDAAALWDVLSGPLADEEWQRALLMQVPVSAEGGCIGMDTTFQLALDQETWI